MAFVDAGQDVQAEGFDIVQAAADTFYPAKQIVQKPPVQAEAMASKALSQGITIPAEVVQITGGPRSVGIALDATQYVDGTEIACALQFLFPNETDWQTAFSFTVNERGLMPDGKTPADAWRASFKTPFPLPDCQARVVTIVKGVELVTQATIGW